MFRTAKTKFDLAELTRRFKRLADGNFSYRKLFLLLLGLCVFFYLIPPIFRYLFGSKSPIKDSLSQCMDERLAPFTLRNLEHDANIRHMPAALAMERDFIPYIGNGYIGMEIAPNAALNIKSRRSIQLPTQFQPLLSVAVANEPAREATVVDYLTGIAHRFQCTANFFVAYEYYAHRTNPSVLMQELRITNLRNTMEEVELLLPRIQLQSLQTRTVQLSYPTATSPLVEHEIATGTISAKPTLRSNNQVIVIAIVRRTLPRILQLRKRGTTRLEYPITIHYSKPLDAAKMRSVVEDTETKALEAMKKFLAKSSTPDFRQDHVNVWRNLWATGFSISTSKAENSLNGDRINATIYAVLSQTRTYEFEEITSLSAPSKQDIAKALTYAEGCYDSYHTLQAENLWLPLKNLEVLNNLVASWMLTLEKQGCHNLMRAGASGVIQAMVLSIGSFRFSNQHLECNIHPKYLHRDFHFRRLNYGNKTHVNVTIAVTDENKAVIYVALDRSDRNYFACDGGCLDEPVQLTQAQHKFPVKLTEPLTAILYITEDKQHMEELHKALHVKEVAEAPAHEQHVIALHKHGHQLGGLPTLFWVSICAIIIVFHIFLCKLIIKEYCEPSDKIRYRYSKP